MIVAVKNHHVTSTAKDEYFSNGLAKFFFESFLFLYDIVLRYLWSFYLFFFLFFKKTKNFQIYLEKLEMSELIDEKSDAKHEVE